MSSFPPPPSEDNGREPAAARAEAPDAAQTRRPRWLVVALLVAMVLGTSSWWDGCARLDMYRAESSQAAARVHATIEDKAARGQAEAAYVHLLDVFGASRSRTVPLASATFVLGAALLALASRGLGGRRGSRAALLQVVLVQAAVAGATFFVTRDVREAEHAWEHACRTALQDQAFPPEWKPRAAAIEDFKLRLEAPFGLATRTLASALVVLALTRPRARASFDAEGAPVPEA
jgi:hypothetical protein